MAKLSSGRVFKLPQSGITSDRYEFLGLEQAEPDLGDPIVGPSSIGARPFPLGDAYVLASFANTEANPNRYWVLTSSLPGIGILPGAITVRDEGTLIGAANSFTTLNFVGDPVTIDFVGPTPQEQSGIATIRISPVAYGSTGEFQFKNSSGLLEGVTDFKYYTDTGNVGFGTTSAQEKLDIVGNIRTHNIYARQELSGSFILPGGENINNFSIIGKLRSGYANFGSIDVSGDASILGKIYASNGRGNSGEVLTSQGSSGSTIWAPTSNVTVGSANSVLIINTYDNLNYNLTFSEQTNNDIGPIRVDVGQLVFNPVSNNLGIGTTNPTSNLHVFGTGRFTGVVTASSFRGSGSLLTGLIPNAIANVDNDQIYYPVLSPSLSGSISSISVSSSSLVFNPGTDSLGIGTTNPAAKLDIFGDVRLSGSDPEIQFNAGGPRLKVPSSNVLTIHTAGNLNSNTDEAVRISADGVGIGTTNIFSSGSTHSLTLAGKIVVGNAIGSTNLSNVLSPNIETSVRAYRSFNLIDTSSVVKIVRTSSFTAGPSIELQHWNGAIDTQYGYWDLVGEGGNFAFRDRIDTGNEKNRIFINTNGTVLIGSTSGNTGISSNECVGFGTDNILQVNGNSYFDGSVGIGITNPSSKLHIIGDGRFTGVVTATTFIGNINSTAGNIDIVDAQQLNVSGVSTFAGITTITESTLFTKQLNVSGVSTFNSNVSLNTLEVSGNSRMYGTLNIEKSVTEKVSTATTFLSQFPVSPLGALSIDVSSSTIAVGILTASVTSWEFTGVSTENSKATTITLIADSSSLITYGEQCKVNGQSVSGGVRWNGGTAPIPTDNEDIISFAIVKDNSGSIRVYGSISLNFS